MKVLKPQYVENEGKPIFSVDIAPCSKKFATGGQGTDSGKIVSAVHKYLFGYSPEENLTFI